MPMLKQGELHIFQGGSLHTTDFYPAKKPNAAVTFEDFELWGYWMNGTIGLAGLPMFDHLLRFRLWFGVEEVA